MAHQDLCDGAQHIAIGRARVALAAFLGALALCAGVAESAEPSDFSGVWAMVQHSRPGAPFFIPVEPELSAEGKALTQAFLDRYDVENLEPNGSCVEPGMPTVMWGIGGAAMEIVSRSIDIGLVVTDIAASLEFYCGTLGWEKVGEMSLPGHRTMHLLRVGDSLVKLQVLHDGAPPLGPRGMLEQAGIRYFTVEVRELERVVEELKRSGCEFTRPFQEISAVSS